MPKTISTVVALISDPRVWGSSLIWFASTFSSSVSSMILNDSKLASWASMIARSSSSSFLKQRDLVYFEFFWSGFETKPICSHLNLSSKRLVAYAFSSSLCLGGTSWSTISSSSSFLSFGNGPARKGSSTLRSFCSGSSLVSSISSSLSAASCR